MQTRYITGLIVAASLLLAMLLYPAAAGEEKEDVVPAYKPPMQQDLTPVVLPPIKDYTLKNGLKVVVVEHHELPVISLRLMCKAGSQLDPRLVQVFKKVYLEDLKSD